MCVIIHSNDAIFSHVVENNSMCFEFRILIEKEAYHVAYEILGV